MQRPKCMPAGADLHGRARFHQGRDVVHAGPWLPAARHLDADDRRAGAGWHAAPTQDRHPRRQRSADWQIASTGSNSAPTSIGSASPCADRASAATAPRVSRLHTRSSLSACRERMRSGPVMLRASARKLLLASIAGRIRNLAVGVPAASRATRRRQLHSGVP